MGLPLSRATWVCAYFCAPWHTLEGGSAHAQLRLFRTGRHSRAKRNKTAVPVCPTLPSPVLHEAHTHTHAHSQYTPKRMEHSETQIKRRGCTAGIFPFSLHLYIYIYLLVVVVRNAPPFSVEQQQKQNKTHAGVPCAGHVCPSGVMSLLLFFLHGQTCTRTHMYACVYA